MNLESGRSNTFRMRFKSLISTALVSTSQEIARQLYPNVEVHQKAWMKVHEKRLLDEGKIEKLGRAAGQAHQRSRRSLRTIVGKVVRAA